MTEPYVRATRYIVNLLPDSIGFYAQLFEITVERRGCNNRWAVIRHDQHLGSDGTWSHAPRPSEREDDWLDTHRFDLDTALRLAKEAAPHVTVKGRTAAEALARLIATDRIAPSTLRRMADEAQQQKPTTADKAAALGMTDTEYRARSHETAVAAVRAAIPGMYAAVGFRLEDVLNEAAETQQPASGPGRVADEGQAEGGVQP